MYSEEAYCVCLLCDKEVGTATRQDRGYYFGDECKDFHPIAERRGDTHPMSYWDKMKVNYFEDSWREDNLILVIGICQKCIKKKFKNVLNKHKFVGNVKKRV